jgi:hypothetical protein
VLQIPGAQNLSNRLYTVHPRRNDRFLRASGILRTIYRDVDFTEFHFTRHMLDHLRCLSEDRFDIVRNELRVAWMARMQRVLSRGARAGASSVARLPPAAGRGPADALGEDPLFVTRTAGGRGTTGGVAERGRGSQSGRWYSAKEPRNRRATAEAARARCPAPMHIGRRPSAARALASE